MSSAHGNELILPHPSGLNRWWQRPGAFEEARAALRSFGALPPATPDHTP